MPAPAHIQAESLRFFTHLTSLRADWPGSLILSVGLAHEGSALAFAALAAGAACLALEPDPSLCRAALRSGACDFLVNTVDESLRILKNEIRQHRPIGVALSLAPEAALAELRERGVLPQLFVDPSRTHPLLGEQPEDFASPQSLAAILHENRWQEHTFQFDSSADVRALDARLQSLIPSADPRHRWLAAAPRLFPRDFTRNLLLTPAESAALAPWKKAADRGVQGGNKDWNGCPPH